MMSVAIASTNTQILNDPTAPSTQDHKDTTTSAQVSLSPGPIAGPISGPELDDPSTTVHNPLLVVHEGDCNEVEYNYDDIGNNDIHDEIRCEEDREMLMEENEAIIDEIRKIEEKNKSEKGNTNGVVVTSELDQNNDNYQYNNEVEGNNNEEMQNLPERRKRVWSIDLGRELSISHAFYQILTLIMYL